MDKKSNDDETECVDFNDEDPYADDGDDSLFVEDEDDTANEFAFIEDDQYEFGDSALSDQPTQNYSVLKEEEIRQLQEDDITKVSTVLSIPKSAACFLLPHFDWSVSKLNDAWFADEDKVREKVGLLKKPVVHFMARDLVACGICFDDYLYESVDVFSADCGHPFCRDCWIGYIGTSINDGPGCLMLRCPEPSCRAAVGSDLISVLTTPEEHERYKHFLLRSYVEGCGRIKWCPAPDCQYAVKLNDDGTGSYGVSCLCSNDFCWNCTEEVHRPVECETVRKWILKNQDDSQDVQWIIVNTKPCPKCKRPIEKNQGCKIMTCRPPCWFRFCWFCLVDIKLCRCNYRATAKLVDSEGERDKKKVKGSLDKYIHYYERWVNNQSSKRKAYEDLHMVQTMHIMTRTLADKQGLQEFQLKFITEAWKQIIECRQILRWTYAYGYYIPENEHLKLQLFEHLQGHAEFSLERLHQCAERDMKKFLFAEGPWESFNYFRTKLMRLTKTTANYFEKLVTALENDLSELDMQGTDKY